MGKVEHISVLQKKARIFALLEIENYAQQEIARIEGVFLQTVQQIACLIRQSTPATSSGRFSWGKRIKTVVREDRLIISCHRKPQIIQ